MNSDYVMISVSYDIWSVMNSGLCDDF